MGPATSPRAILLLALALCGAYPRLTIAAEAPGPQSSCPSVTGVGCLSLAASSPPAISDPFTMVATDLATRVYGSPASAEAYATSALAAPAARFISNNSTDTQLIVAGSNDTILIAFRGSSGDADWVTNFDSNNEQATFGAAGNASVHHGFLKAMESVYPELINTLREFDSEGRAKIYVTGHSLGSGLAQLAAAKLATDDALPAAWRNVSGVYSFGGPRVGGDAWEQVYDNATGLGAKTLRVVIFKDIVPLLPPENMGGGFVHVGRTYILPLALDSCAESAADEYDACAPGAGAIDFDKRLGPDHTCSSLLGSAGATNFCDSQGVQAVSGNALGEAEDSAAGSGFGLVQLAGLLCSAVDINTLAGTPCCALLETGVNTLTGQGTALQFHYPNLYMTALSSACLSKCAYGQWQRCGGGWAAKESDFLKQPIPEDPAAEMAPGIADAGVDAIVAAFAAFGGRVNAPAPAPAPEVVVEASPGVETPPAPALAASGDGRAASSFWALTLLFLVFFT